MARSQLALRLRVYIFSYNRAQFLQNVVDSVVQQLPDAELTIVDDDSEDRRTRTLLQRYERENRHQVLRPSTHVERRMFKTGGLYANKTLALHDAIAAYADYALFVHDDQQIVRRVDDTDMERFDAFFAANPRSIELHTCFMKHDLRESDAQLTRIDDSGTAYFRDHPDSRGHKHFTGSGLFHVGRTRALFDTFPLGEKVNEAFFGERGIFVGFYAWPLMAWLPFPISYRGKKRVLSHRVMEWLGGGGFHPVQYLSGDSARYFMERDIRIRPVAEDFLVAPTAPKAEKWSHMGGFHNASARRGFRKAVARLIWKRVRREPE
ncbi:glycosyltransferase family A protein [Salinisphaera sp.]|uniref:glycosyltransferase family A protein n=1 Tax=Salinisphaera sp. TaxID=1914330 RepID=UPI002D7841F3|nr:glycosyltransferase family A protein [Salinisphaera sp.]HET7315582.1 glycosyltransferase family A protein [Salinisphaera sp.]